MGFEMSKLISSRINTIPNLLSFLRILMIIPISYYIWQDRLNIVIILIVIAIITDFLDGIIARHYNQISEVGKILDPMADKLSCNAILIILAIKDTVPVWLVVLVAGRDLVIVIAASIIVKKYRFITSSNFIGKLTVNIIGILIIAYIFKLEYLYNILIPLSAFFIFLSAYSYSKNFLYLHKKLGDSQLAQNKAQKLSKDTNYRKQAVS